MTTRWRPRRYCVLLSAEGEPEVSPRWKQNISFVETVLKMNVISLIRSGKSQDRFLRFHLNLIFKIGHFWSVFQWEQHQYMGLFK